MKLQKRKKQYGTCLLYTSIGRPLMTPDELKSLPKGHFILAKTGCHPMRVELRLFFKWGIEFEEEYEVEQHVARPVSYADRLEVEQEIIRRQFDEDGEADFDEPVSYTHLLELEKSRNFSARSI